MPVKVPPAQSIALNDSLNGFTCIRIQPIEELNVTAYEFVHQKNGARLIHIFNDDPDNLFSIAFRTPVYDSTGVPHILEHSVLCGSKKFPIKDPFQELLKGSLQTFLNALTYPDKTVYPVSSQVEKDYYNLDSFVIYITLEGNFEVETEEGIEKVSKGETVLIPASTEFLKLNPQNGKVKLLEVYIS